MRKLPIKTNIVVLKRLYIYCVTKYPVITRSRFRMA